MSSHFAKMKSPFRGGGPRWLSRKMIHGFHAVEILRRRPRNSTYIAQGSWNVGFADSAGSHDKSGVGDTYEDTAALRNEFAKWCRKIGFPAYHRTKAQGFDPHVHVITHDDPGMGSYAMLQDETYPKGRNGLGKNAAAGPDNEWAPRDRTVELNIGAWTGEWRVTSTTHGYSQASKDVDLRKKRREVGFVVKNHLCTVNTGNGRIYVVTDNGTFYDRSKLKCIKRLSSRTA